jgi:hypothetical protein
VLRRGNGLVLINRDKENATKKDKIKIEINEKRNDEKQNNLEQTRTRRPSAAKHVLCSLLRCFESGGGTQRIRRIRRADGGKATPADKAK